MKRRKFFDTALKLSKGTILSHLIACHDFEDAINIYGGIEPCSASVFDNRSEKYIIYNNDGNDLIFSDLLRRQRVSSSMFYASRFEKIKKFVTHIFYCTGFFNYYTHNSKLSEKLYPGIHSDLEKFSLKDTLENAVNFCRLNSKKIYWSVRMNDIHDSYDPKLLSNWKRKNQHLLMGRSKKFKYANHWSACNYEYDEIRQLLFELICETITNYDLDGIELDFMRHPVFFKEQLLGKDVTDDQRELMSVFVSEIRGYLNDISIERQKPISLSIRIPDSLGYAMAIGLDVNSWICADLVDLIVYGGYFQLEPIIEVFELSNKYGIPFIPCVSQSRYQRDVNMPGYYYDHLKAEILLIQRLGISNLYFFNFFDDKLLGIIQNLDSLESIVDYQRVIGGEIDFWLRSGKAYLKH